MGQDDGKKWRNLRVEDGGRATERRTSAEVEFERAVYGLFAAMRDRDGRSVNGNFRNIARGHIKPLRVAMKRLKDAKAARNHARNYPLAKQIAREIDRYVDVLWGKRVKQEITGEHEPAA